MPRFYFHVRSGREKLDEEGTVLPSLRAARREALHFVGDMLLSESNGSALPETWSLDVADITGATLFRVRIVAEETQIGRGASLEQILITTHHSLRR